MSLQEHVETSTPAPLESGDSKQRQQTPPVDIIHPNNIDVLSAASPEGERKSVVSVGNFHDTRKNLSLADQLGAELKTELLQLIGRQKIEDTPDVMNEDSQCDVTYNYDVIDRSTTATPYITTPETPLALVNITLLNPTSNKKLTPKKFQCSVCPFSANMKSKLVAHERSHSGSKPFKCTECSFAAAHKSHLNRHLRIHTGEVFKCPLCSYVATEKSYLVTHNRIHTGEKPFQCTECSFRSAHKATMKVHMRAHAGKKPMRPFQCSDCSYSATCQSKMIIHQRSHTGEKPYKCPDCPFAAPQNSLLKKHRRMHTDGKAFKCTECNFASAYKGNLTKHMKTHTDKFFK